MDPQKKIDIVAAISALKHDNDYIRDKIETLFAKATRELAGLRSNDPHEKYAAQRIVDLYNGDIGQTFLAANDKISRIHNRLFKTAPDDDTVLAAMVEMQLVRLAIVNTQNAFQELQNDIRKEQQITNKEPVDGSAEKD